MLGKLCYVEIQASAAEAGNKRCAVPAGFLGVARPGLGLTRDYITVVVGQVVNIDVETSAGIHVVER